MEKKYHFTKEHTLAIKGIAVCFLLSYHCFSREFRLSGVDVQFWPLSKELAMQISYSMVICVGMFAFLSAYGLTLSMKKRFPEYVFSADEAFSYVVERYMKLIFMFLLPFLFCQIVTELLDVSRYEGGRTTKLVCMLMDALGISNIFGTKMLVDTWWYLSLVVLITVFMPVCMILYRRLGWLLIPMGLFVGNYFLDMDSNLDKWMFTIPIAICFADRNVLERLKAWKIVPGQILNKIIKFLFLTCVLVLADRLRASEWGIQHLKFLMNGVMPVLFIWWCYEFVTDIPGLKQILQFLGKHSAVIFYVHTLVRGLWLKELTYSFRYAILIWLFLLAVSLGISIFLNFAAKVIRYDQITKYLEKLVLKKLSYCSLRSQ